MISFFYFTAIILLLLLCVFLCLIILLQEGKTTGLGASFGGDTNESLFGTSTADVLKQLTGWLGCIFLVTCVVLSIWTSSLERSRASSLSSSPPIEEIETTK